MADNSNTTRRNILKAMPFIGAIATIPVVAQAEIMPPSLEERLAKMDPMRRAEVLSCMLAKAMKEVNPGPWDVKFDTHRDGARCVLIMKRI